mgnify:CR=1 FL=1
MLFYINLISTLHSVGKTKKIKTEEDDYSNNYDNLFNVSFALKTFLYTLSSSYKIIISSIEHSQREIFDLNQLPTTSWRIIIYIIIV